MKKGNITKTDLRMIQPPTGGLTDIKARPRERERVVAVTH